MRAGDLILVRGNDLLDRAIERVEHSPYSHVAGYVGDGLIIQAEGFRRTDYGALSFYGGQGVFTCPGLTDEQRRRIVAYVEAQVGTHYDYLCLAWELARYALHLALPRWVERERFLCSTLWADAYLSAGVDLCPGVWFPSPADLAQSPLLEQVGTVPDYPVWEEW